MWYRIPDFISLTLTITRLKLFLEIHMHGKLLDYRLSKYKCRLDHYAWPPPGFKDRQSRKHETITQCWFGTMSVHRLRRWPNNVQTPGLMSSVYCETITALTATTGTTTERLLSALWIQIPVIAVTTDVSPLVAAVTSSSQHSTIIMIIYKAPWLSPSPLDATLDPQSHYMMQTNYSLTLATLKYCSDSYVLVSFFRLI